MNLLLSFHIIEDYKTKNCLALWQHTYIYRMLTTMLRAILDMERGKIVTITLFWNPLIYYGLQSTCIWVITLPQIHGCGNIMSLSQRYKNWGDGSALVRQSVTCSPEEAWSIVKKLATTWSRMK